MGRESALGTWLVGSGAGGEGYIRIPVVLVLGLECDDAIISPFAGYNVISYLGSSSTFNFCFVFVARAVQPFSLA